MFSCGAWRLPAAPIWPSPLASATRRLVDANGSGARPLAVGGRGAVDPVFGRDGSLLFVRDGTVWLLRPGVPRPARVAGPLGALSGRAIFQTYYGYVPYPELTAWTLARPAATAGNS